MSAWIPAPPPESDPATMRTRPLGFASACAMSHHMADHVRISKTLSYWLRHQPDAAALVLDPRGWTSVDAVLAALAQSGLAHDIDTLLAVVEQSDKQRFELAADLTRIRARQGHSVTVDLDL